MTQENPPHFVITSVAEQHRLLALPAPPHPLVSVLQFDELRPPPTTTWSGLLSTGFYTVAVKKNCPCKTAYGQLRYDFDHGVLSLVAPGKAVLWNAADSLPPAGWLLLVHPDLIRRYALAHRLKSYSFWHYAAHEALHLSAAEEATLDNLLLGLQQECRAAPAGFSEEMVVTYFDLLLQYANRFYNRQFASRRLAGRELLAQLDAALYSYLNSEQTTENGVPTAHYLAGQVHMSASYLTDLLKRLTGQSTQQYIHGKLLDKAKELLGASKWSVAEIAYCLGFEHPQSFSKLFKQKTGLSPLQFRQASHHAASRAA
ncbi:helix-turn-helix domain-containing protein [Hymenobacter weizhouensis]|uniref:helix-turn-helix domain-containing protein n=1 Tax=Hymenobacter sp. YIM 151500-1 TaxID=2987689 RepID=UPI002226A9A6|nr:helix-turn-helix transcriptional regulator [Hymenobacter sp. YIM 151500-1]UYZ65009.1 helix-turn-helix transcriptional regulator [Hymenobacter sp. YIM 151500-1]